MLESRKRKKLIYYVDIFLLFSFSFRQLNRQGNVSYLQSMSVHQWPKKCWAVCWMLARLQRWCAWWGVKLLLFVAICSLSFTFDTKVLQSWLETRRKLIYIIFCYYFCYQRCGFMDQMLKAARFRKVTLKMLVSSFNQSGWGCFFTYWNWK